MTFKPPLVVVIFSHLVMVSRGHLPPVSGLSETSYSSEGHVDFTLGALLPVHTTVCQAFGCKESLNDFSLLQRMEAITYAVEEINANTNLLQGYTLGYTIYDDQYKDTTALAQALRFIQRQKTCSADALADGEDTMGCMSPGVNGMRYHEVAGVIASENSPTTLQVASLFTSFRLPQISYLATSSNLSSKRKYPYFFRTLPADGDQAEAIVALMRRFNWKYASVVFSAGSYGTSGYRDLHQTAKQYDICFGIIREIDDTWKVRQYKHLILELLLERKATAVVAFITLSHARILLALAEGMGIEGRITWIATDTWLNELTDLPEPALAKVVGSLSVKPLVVTPTRFTQRFRELTPSNTRNPWMTEFLETYFDCTYPNNSTRYRACLPNLKIGRRSQGEKTVSLVYDTVYAFAHGLNDALDSDTCRRLLDREEKRRCAMDNLHISLRTVRFQGETGEVKFDDGTLSVSRPYVIYNIQNKTGQWSLVNVGTYDVESKVPDIDVQKIQWSRGSKPNSTCNNRCQPGYAQRVTERCCCLECEACADHHIVIQSVGGRLECQACMAGEWPDQTTRDRCKSIQPTYVKWHEPLGVIICSLASTGLAACAVIFILYVMNNNHPLVKSASREVSYFLLASLSLCYCFCFCFIIQPSGWVCIARQTGVCLCFTLIYGPLVTKTSRIYRIFEAGSKNKKPLCVGTNSQLGIVIIIVLIQCSLLIGFLLAKPPVVVKREEKGVNRVDLTCSSHTVAYITSISYNGLLLLAAMYCAFKTRKLPDSFNESKFMAFCVYSTVIIWLSFIPASFAVRTAFLQTMLMSLGLIVNSTLVLVCFFAPKLVAVYLVDQSNVNRRGFRFKGRMRARSSTGVSPLQSLREQHKEEAKENTEPQTEDNPPLQKASTQTVFVIEDVTSEQTCDHSATAAMAPINSNHYEIDSNNSGVKVEPRKLSNALDQSLQKTNQIHVLEKERSDCISTDQKNDNVSPGTSGLE